MKFLVVEDDEIFSRIVKEFLDPYGQVKIINSGEEAIENINKENENYDIFFIDLMMPKKNGFDVIKQINELQEKGKYTDSKIVVISALQDTNTMDEANKFNIDAYLTKPIKEYHIKNLLEELNSTTR